MPSSIRRAPARARPGFARTVLRFVGRALKLVLVAFAAGFGAARPPPPLLRHEDPVVLVAEDEVP